MEGSVRHFIDYARKVNKASLALLPSDELRSLYNLKVAAVEGQFNIRQEGSPVTVGFNANMVTGDEEGDRVIRFNCRLPEGVEPLCIYLIPADREIDNIVETLSREEKTEFFGQDELSLNSLIVRKTDQEGFEILISSSDEKEEIVDPRNQMLLLYFVPGAK